MAKCWRRGCDNPATRVLAIGRGLDASVRRYCADCADECRQLFRGDVVSDAPSRVAMIARLQSWIALRSLRVYLLLWPTFCHRCDRPARSRHYRRCAGAKADQRVGQGIHRSLEKYHRSGQRGFLDQLDHPKFDRLP